MKKLLSVLLCGAMLVSMGVMLSSCGHECEFSDAWSKDAEYHWHACTGEECEEIADKAAHTWNEGAITTAATQEADGVKTFTCTACDATKTEPVLFTGMTEAEWNAVFDMANFQNFEYKETSVVTGSGVTVETETTYRFTSEGAWAKMTAAGSTEESYAPDLESANMVREYLVESLKDTTPYAKFAYDATTKTYKATEGVYIEALGADTTSLVLTFENGKIVKMEYEVAFVQEGISFTANAVVTVSNYGKVVLDQ